MKDSKNYGDRHDCDALFVTQNFEFKDIKFGRGGKGYIVGKLRDVILLNYRVKSRYLQLSAFNPIIEIYGSNTCRYLPLGSLVRFVNPSSKDLLFLISKKISKNVICILQKLAYLHIDCYRLITFTQFKI